MCRPHGQRAWSLRMHGCSMRGPPACHTPVHSCSRHRRLAVKDAAEKDTFFKRLPKQLPAIPAAVAERKLLPLIGRALEFGGAGFWRGERAMVAPMSWSRALLLELQCCCVPPAMSALSISSTKTLTTALMRLGRPGQATCVGQDSNTRGRRVGCVRWRAYHQARGEGVRILA